MLVVELLAQEELQNQYAQAILKKDAVLADAFYGGDERDS